MHVTVIIPSYNNARRLGEAIASVRAQTVSAWDMVVIDDGSRDAQAAEQVVAAHSDPRIRICLSRRNRGAARARNIGIRLAQGDFIAFLDCDDLWAPDKLERQLDVMRKTGAAMSCTAYRNVDEETGKVSVRSPMAWVTYDGLLGNNCIGCSTVMVNRAALGRSYFPNIRMRQDFAHWLKVLQSGHAIIGLPEVLTTRRTYKGSLSANKLRAVWYTWRMYREIMGFSRPQALRYFTSYLRRGVLGR
jgi:teichuronic acid biosynthesis glycosyltransferase TuaG